jgi:hypothetical protein
MTAVSDPFTRGDSTSLGANWTEVGGVGDWEIKSNKLQCNTDAGALGYYARYEQNVGSSDMFASAVVTSVQTSSNSNTGVAVRMRSAAVTSYQIDIRHAGDILWFWKIVAGVETQLTNQMGSTSLSVPSASGDTVRGEVVGSLIRAKINGAIVGFCRDTSIGDGERPGVNGWNEIAADVLEIDSFAGGALVADGGLVAPYVVGVNTLATGAGTTLTPSMPTVAAGELVIIQTTSRDAAQTMTAPAGEGWVSIQNPSQTGLEDVVWAKIWGLGGQTDDTTPTFGIGVGTGGWAATVTVWRNPSHATLPWTSVASAVVASGSGTNTSSTTVTAPSVSYDGTHCTVVRVVSSADDNGLNAPSAGGGVYGGVNYHTTVGNDLAQGMSVVEDVTVTTNTGTSTFTESVAGPDVSNGMTLILAIPSVVPVGVLAEVDALLATTRSGSKSAALLAETDALVSVSRTGAQTVSALAELDVLQPVAHTHAPLISALAETDVLTGVARSVTTQLGSLTEIDVLLAAPATHSQAAGTLGAETDSLFAPAQSTIRPVVALMTSEVLAGTVRSVSTLLGSLTEADALLAALRSGSKVVGPLGELDDLAGALAAPEVGALAEQDQLLAVGHQTQRPVLVLSEISGLLLVQHTSARDVVALAEVEQLLAAGRTGAQAVGLLSELDALLAPIVVVTDVQITVGDLRRRVVVADLARIKRSIGELGHRVRPGELAAHNIRGELVHRYHVDELEAEL